MIYIAFHDEKIIVIEHSNLKAILHALKNTMLILHYIYIIYNLTLYDIFEFFIIVMATFVGAECV